MVLKDTHIEQFLLWEGCGDPSKELIFNNFLLWAACGGLKRTDFSSFHFGRVWWSWKVLIFNR